jgi:SAM-dependent methyltransferase
MTVSQFHVNRQPHNWLVFDDCDRFLTSCIPHYKGVLCDLGCGDAVYKPFFEQYAQRYVGIDWTKSIHDLKADVVADLNQPLPLSSSVADTVVSLSVLEHLREPQTMLDEAFRILKPGGTLILQVPWQWCLHEAPHDYFRCTPYALRHMLGKAGFSEVVIQAQSGFFSMWENKMNYFTFRLITESPRRRLIIRACLRSLWYLGQKLAPWLDRKLDHDWLLEASMYDVRATKARA